MFNKIIHWRNERIKLKKQRELERSPEFLDKVDELRRVANFDRKEKAAFNSAVKRGGLSISQLEVLACHGFDEIRIQYGEKYFRNNASEQKVKLLQRCRFLHQLEGIEDMIHDDLTFEQMDLLIQQFASRLAMNEGRFAFKNKLSMEKVKFFYKKGFTWHQMREARLGFEAGLSMEKVGFYYREGFTDKEMEQARKAFEEGRTMAEVKRFYSMIVPVPVMYKARAMYRDGGNIEDVDQFLQDTDYYEYYSRFDRERLSIAKLV